jgi:hypothetical protein
MPVCNTNSGLGVNVEAGCIMRLTELDCIDCRIDKAMDCLYMQLHSHVWWVNGMMMNSIRLSVAIVTAELQCKTAKERWEIVFSWIDSSCCLSVDSNESWLSCEVDLSLWSALDWAVCQCHADQEIGKREWMRSKSNAERIDGLVSGADTRRWFAYALQRRIQHMRACRWEGEGEWTRMARQMRCDKHKSSKYCSLFKQSIKIALRSISAVVPHDCDWLTTVVLIVLSCHFSYLPLVLVSVACIYMASCWSHSSQVLTVFWHLILSHSIIQVWFSHLLDQIISWSSQFVAHSLASTQLQIKSLHIQQNQIFIQTSC